MKKNKNQIITIFIMFLLIIQLDVHAKPYKGGELRTKESFLYGRFEAKIKSAEKEGMLASFFTFYDGTDIINNWNEIDIEIMGRYSDDIQFNTITPGQVNHVSHALTDFNPHADFHVYAFEWTPDYVAWFIDGIEVYRQTGSHISSLNKPQKIMMNIWSPEAANWAGKWNPEVLPAFAFYDFVSYYEFVPGTGNYGTNNDFKLKWNDEFESWNQTRWDKATHTFDGNRVDFIRENVVFKDGKMILCLTDLNNTGFVDNSVPKILWAKALNENLIKINFTEALEISSAENISNYSISGVEIISAKLQSDLKTVDLKVTGFDKNSDYQISANQIKDNSENQNTLLSQSVNLLKSEELSFPLKINIGGSSYLDYLADFPLSENSEYGYLDGRITQSDSTLSIARTDDDQIYRDEIYGLVKYNINVPNGVYNINFLMAEKYFLQQNRRVFDISIEGIKLLANVDVYKSVGRNNAYQRSVNQITVKDNILNIHFTAKIDNPILSGIILEQVSVTEVQNEAITPGEFILEQNFPNPFNNSTKIIFRLSKEENIKLKIFDILGNAVFTDDLGFKKPGSYEILWSGKDNGGKEISSGVYFCQIQGEQKSQIKKMILLK